MVFKKNTRQDKQQKQQNINFHLIQKLFHFQISNQVKIHQLKPQQISLITFGNNSRRTRTKEAKSTISCQLQKIDRF